MTNSQTVQYNYRDLFIIREQLSKDNDNIQVNDTLPVSQASHIHTSCQWIGNQCVLRWE